MLQTGRYDYRDGDGELQYYKLRFIKNDGKKTFSFNQIKDGVEVRGLDGVTRIPYALPRILDAVEEGAVLFYVEGEKDADALNNMGIHATTLGGANDLRNAIKSNPEIPSYFSQVDKVVIVPDNDQPGRKLAAEVFTAITGFRTGGPKGGVYFLEPPGVPEKGDISDWLETCGAEDKSAALLDLVAQSAKQFTDQIVKDWSGAEAKKVAPSPNYSVNVAEKFQNIRNRLTQIKPSGDYKFNACCPAHDDRTPSLTVTLQGDRILIHCHTNNCSTEAIMSAMGLSITDLFADEARPSLEAIAVARESILRSVPDSVAEMEHKKLPSVISNYVDECQKISSGSSTSCAIALITILGGYLGQNCRFPGYFGHTLYPNIWALSIAGSGSFKSTMVKLASKKLRADDSEFLTEIRRLQQSQEEFKPGSEDWQVVDQEIKQQQGQTLSIPERITLEALFQEFRYRSKGVWLPDEFSSWLKMSAASYNEGMKNLLTELYDPDQTIKKITKSGGLEVMENAFISICTTSTIEFIKGKDSKDRLIKEEDAKTGFFARFLLFRVPDISTTPPALPIESKIIEETDAYWEFSKLCDHLKGIGEPINMKFSDEAREYFTGWHHAIWDLKEIMDKEQFLYDLLRSYSSRWSPYCIKLSMILQQCLAPRTNIITLRAVQGAISILDFVIQSTKDLFRRELGETYVEETKRRVLEYVAERGEVQWGRLITSKTLRHAGARKYEEVVNDLVESGKLIKLDAPGNKSLTKIMLKG